MFPEAPTERMALLAKISPASYNSEQNTTAVDVAKYNRILILIHVGALGSSTTLDADVEQRTSVNGTPKNVTGKSITQLTQAGSDANKDVAINVRTEELDVNNGYHFLNLELTPAVSTAIVGAEVYGCEPKQHPVDATGWDEVVD